MIVDACELMDRERKDMVSLLLTEEEIAIEREKSKPRPRPAMGGRGLSSPSLSLSPKSPGRSKRHTVNFHASTVNHEMKSKKTPQETELAAVSIYISIISRCVLLLI